MLFTLTNDPQFYGLKVSLSNILMIGLFRSNNMMVIFSRTKEVHFHSKYVRNHTFMTSTWKGRVLKFVMYLQILFCFKTRDLMFMFADGVGWGWHNCLFFAGVINVWLLNGLKLQWIWLLKAAVSSSPIQIHFDCHREQPLAPLHQHH